MLRTRLAALAVPVLLASCGVSVDNLQPVVSQFNGDSVSIQLNGNVFEFLAAEDKQVALNKADAEAARICAKGPKKKAEFASFRNVPTGQYSYVIERLYLCLH
ncbi:hypothetical protein [Sinisalibacter aestuarii]|uniref:Lipoprotein n=1 Tax=Sinisalibacter aestuarii TaxID=2949426 RepID=A0ABQ5LSE9_9RHOB|nr:hypothetical protein [Sinisalibacter aestuarii]GKY86992.1 hypothetical protein STA1M1_08610 [Sinisalibacter aestuarii]